MYTLLSHWCIHISWVILSPSRDNSTCLNISDKHDVSHYTIIFGDLNARLTNPSGDRHKNTRGTEVLEPLLCVNGLHIWNSFW